jgi:hypothetical protein
LRRVERISFWQVDLDLEESFFERSVRRSEDDGLQISQRIILAPTRHSGRRALANTIKENAKLEIIQSFPSNTRMIVIRWQL